MDILCGASTGTAEDMNGGMVGVCHHEMLEMKRILPFDNGGREASPPKAERIFCAGDEIISYSIDRENMLIKIEFR
jgi:hypothetical protein